MRCLACGAEMMLVRVHQVQDDTTASPNIEDHSFMCLECRAIEARTASAPASIPNGMT
jgi:hypothetical protein